MGAIMKNTDGSFHSSNINYHLNSNFKSLTTDSKNIANLKAAANLLDLIPQSDENYSSFKNQLSGSQSSNIDQSINEIEDLLKSYYKNILNNAHPLKIQVTKDKLRIDQEANVIADRFNSVKTLIDNSSNITDELRSKFNMLEKECNNLDNEVLSAYIKMYTDAIDFCSSESFKHYYLEGNTLNLLLKNRPFSDPNEYITLINNLKPIIPDEILSKNEQAFAKCQVMIKQYNDNQSKEKLAEEMAPLEDDMIATAHNVIMLYFQEKEARQRGYSTVANDLKQQHRDNLQKLCNYKRDYITKYGVSEYNKFYKKALSNEAHMVPDAQAKIHFSISYDLCK
jgi:archaellum component FlaC